MCYVVIWKNADTVYRKDHFWASLKPGYPGSVVKNRLPMQETGV